jgi:starch-binding outer membrane protein, SusD/RagB family
MCHSKKIKMMKNNILKAILLLCVIVMACSCSLDEYNPAENEGDETLTTFVGWKGLQTTCYSSLYGQLFSAVDYLAVAEAGTDLWITPTNKTWAPEVFYYEGLATNTNYTNKLFKEAYAMINTCNAVINRASKVTDGSASDIDVLTAEARCLRAYYYSILVTNYGNVTLTLDESSNGIVLDPKRSTYSELYSQMVTDLKYAADHLGVTPYNGEYARCTKKTALGLLARVYAQGAGEGLTENGESYWKRAKEVAEDLINNASSYGAYLYSDVSDVWAQANNRSNKEALFTAVGPDAYSSLAASYAQSNLFSYTMANPYSLNDIYKTKDKSNYLYGRVNAGIFAPSKYLIDLFDAAHDKRWENSFTTAFGDCSYEESTSWAGTGTYKSKTVTLTAALCSEYGIGTQFIGKKIYPYADFKYKAATLGNQYIAKVWSEGTTTADTTQLVTVKNIYVNPYPLGIDDNRFIIYLSKDELSATDKAQRGYACVNIDDLFDSNNEYKSASFDNTNSYQLFPSLNKFDWNYDGVFGSDLQKKVGNVMIMRMAEVYLIAAEAEQELGNGTAAAQYLNVLRERAARSESDYQNYMKLTTASEQDVLDEYARELCGEFNRWALLKRHKAFESQLKKGNKRAAAAFTSKNYLRPISYDFLNQISDASDYGTNGY